MIRDILKINDVETVPVEVPEWKTTVHVRTLSGDDRAQLTAVMKQLEKQNRLSDLATHTVILACCEPNGERCFSKDDFGALNGKSAKALERIAAAAMKLNGMAEDAVEDAKKNSERTDNSPSSSSSASLSA